MQNSPILGSAVALLLWFHIVATPVYVYGQQCESQVVELAEYERLDRAAKVLHQDLLALRNIRKITDPAERAKAREVFYTPKDNSMVAKSVVIANYAFSMLLASQVARGYVTDPKAVFQSVLTIPAALFSASAVSWFFHKSLDSFMSEGNPIWGSSVRNFRKHHEYATGHNKDSYVNHIADVAKILSPAFLAAAVTPMDPAMGAATWVFLVSLMNASEVHRQAHLGRNANWFFQFLQKSRMAITQKAHNVHHKDPFNTDYDILFGWSNKPFNALKLDSRLDRLFFRLFKRFRRMPSNWIHSPDSIPPEIVRELMADLEKGVDHVPRSLWVTVDHIQALARDRGKEESRVPDEVYQLVRMSKALDEAHHNARDSQ